VSILHLPAEWEPQRALLLAWPHPFGDWADRLEAIRSEYIDFIKLVLDHQPVILLTHPDDPDPADALSELPGLHRCALAHNDTWCRDYGPIGLLGPDRSGIALDFHFNAWGGKYEALDDDRVNQSLLEHPLLSDFQRRDIDFELEGGAIDGDGTGRVLINWHCLETRHPTRSRAELAGLLETYLHADEILGIDIPALPGDDTDGHIDTLARFIDPHTIVYQTSRDAERDRLMQRQLDELRTRDGRPYRLLGLPAVEGFDPSLPANYVNFLLVNGACLVPAYGVASDRQALDTFAALLPERRVRPVRASTMISQFGGPHCASMNIPEPRP
jgi:agmatine/peptidylarginine deiminase